MATLCAQRILSTNKFTIFIFYVVQIILIVVLLECEVDPCPDKSRLRFDLIINFVKIVASTG